MVKIALIVFVYLLAIFSLHTLPPTYALWIAGTSALLVIGINFLL